MKRIVHCITPGSAKKVRQILNDHRVDRAFIEAKQTRGLAFDVFVIPDSMNTSVDNETMAELTGIIESALADTKDRVDIVEEIGR